MYIKYKIVPFCPYHFVRIPCCPYHFVRTILSNTILSGHRSINCKWSAICIMEAKLNLIYGKIVAAQLPIIRRQVSGLKCDQLAFVSACCSSNMLIRPLRSLSTDRNHWWTWGSIPGGAPAAGPPLPPQPVHQNRGQSHKLSHKTTRS